MEQWDLAELNSDVETFSLTWRDCQRCPNRAGWNVL